MSAMSELAYERQRDREADRHFAPEFDCQWCNCRQSGEETCTECGESLICPKCGDNDIHRASGTTSCGIETDYRACGHCDHQWGHE